MSFITNNYIIEKFIGNKKIPRRSQKVRSLGGHGVIIYFPLSEQDHIDDNDRGKYFNKNERNFVNTFSETNTWNDMIFEYMKRVRGTIPRPVVINEADSRLLVLMNENNRLRELIAEYV